MRPFWNEREEAARTHPAVPTLPNSVFDLLSLYDREESNYIRICALAKIKNLIITEAVMMSSIHSIGQSSLHRPTIQKHSQQIFSAGSDGKTSIFSIVLLQFLRRNYRSETLPPQQIRLFFHVVSLAIKYYYKQHHFKQLFEQITDLIEIHKERTLPALHFFSEVISTLEYNHSQSIEQSLRRPHCKFQRHFVSVHLNSMLMIANFFMEKSVLSEEQGISDGMLEAFKLKTSDQNIYAIMDLLHKVLCFDYIGQKYSDDQDNQNASIIIPTKNTKYTNLSQFQKWLKNSQWIRVYQFVHHHCKKIQLKILIIQTLGDMARIHMKYFKTKNSFRVHIENVLFALTDIMQHLSTTHNINQVVREGIQLGRSFLKLSSPAVVPLMFEINPNILSGALESLKSFLNDRIFGQDVFNVNLIYYFFKFLLNLQARSKVERSEVPFQIVERITRDLCRQYEGYMRTLFHKIFKIGYKEEIIRRQDYLKLKESLQTYNSEELIVYFSPFRFMKPRYSSINAVQQLLLYSCARVTRACHIFTTFTRHPRQRQYALQMIEKTINQTFQWYSYTSFFKAVEGKSKSKSLQNSMLSQQGTKIQLNLASISEEYEEQIQNEDDYCHGLRVICFFALENMIIAPQYIYKDFNRNGEIFKLIRLTVYLCFWSDLNESSGRLDLSINIRAAVEHNISLSLKILEKVLLKDWQYMIFLLQKNGSKNSYKFSNNSDDLQYIQLGEVQEALHLLYELTRIKSPFINDNQYINFIFKQIEILLNYTVAKEKHCKIQTNDIIRDRQDFQSLLAVLSNNTALMTLYEYGQPRWTQFITQATHLFIDFNQFPQAQHISDHRIERQFYIKYLKNSITSMIQSKNKQSQQSKMQIQSFIGQILHPQQQKFSNNPPKSEKEKTNSNLSITMQEEIQFFQIDENKNILNFQGENEKLQQSNSKEKDSLIIYPSSSSRKSASNSSGIKQQQKIVDQSLNGNFQEFQSFGSKNSKEISNDNQDETEKLSKDDDCDQTRLLDQQFQILLPSNSQKSSANKESSQFSMSQIHPTNSLEQ